MNRSSEFQCGLVILAAGASTRMGRPKQLLPMYGGRPLLRHGVESALTGPVSPVIVVLGANASEIAPCLTGLAVQLVKNAAWAEGMGSSLRCGMEALLAAVPGVQNVIVTLADQPDLPAGHFSELLKTQRATGQPIVASACEGVRGPPVLFTAKYFPALRTLQGDAGARTILREHAAEVATVPLRSIRDLDTPSDYSDYINGH
jgi:molybdenum cofactor cytidylyltransferase